MNRHDVLYNRGREIWNSRVQRVWFHLNPYLERSFRINEDSKYDVTSSKFVEPLQSVVICEDYFKDRPAYWREVSVDSFWEFLQTDEWTDGYSLRVLDGQLLDWITTTLNMWEEASEVVSHETHAFARNTREIRSCYKNGKTDQIYGNFEEVLLIEFKYYGKNTQQHQRVNSRGSRRCYESTGSISSCTLGPFSTKSPTFTDWSRGSPSPDLGIKKRAKPSKSQTRSILKSPTASHSKSPTAEPSKCSVRPSSKTPPIPHTKKSAVTISLMATPTGSTPASNTVYIEGVDIFGEGPITSGNEKFDAEFYLNEEYRECSEGTKFSMDEYFQNKKSEFNQIRADIKQEILALQEHEQNLKKKRELQRAVLSAAAPPEEGVQENVQSMWLRRFVDGVPSFSDYVNLLDQDNKFDPRFKKWKQRQKKIKRRYKLDKRRSSKIPETCIVIPDASEQQGPEAENGVSRGGRTNMRRLSLSEETETPVELRRSSPKEPTKPETTERHGKINVDDKFAEQVVGVTDFLAFKETVNQANKSQKQDDSRPVVTHPAFQNSPAYQSAPLPNTSRSPPLSAAQNQPLLPPVQQQQQQTKYTNDPVLEEIEETSPTDDMFDSESAGSLPEVIVTTPSGMKLPGSFVGFKFQAKNIAMEEAFVQGGAPEYFFEAERKAKTSAPALQNKKPKKKPRELTMNVLEEHQRVSKNRSSYAKQSTASSKRGSILQQSSMLDGSPDDWSSDDEEDVPMHGVSSNFNTLKLNTWYSMEKLRGKDYYKKKPAFMEVLEKYRQLQRAVCAFKKPGEKFRARRAKRGIQAIRAFQRTEGKSEKESQLVGKLRDFEFLRKKSENDLLNIPRQVPCSFKTVTMSEFRDKLKKAMDKFVIRQEHVVSSQNYQSVTTITFTRHEVFSNFRL